VRKIRFWNCSYSRFELNWIYPWWLVDLDSIRFKYRFWYLDFGRKRVMSRGNYKNPCLTMHQPWASLLVHGIKRIEGRSWPSPIRGKKTLILNSGIRLRFNLNLKHCDNCITLKKKMMLFLNM